MNPRELQLLMSKLSPAERSELEQLLAASPRPPEFRDDSFAEQQAFLDDPSPMKVAFCTRRSGKSFGAGRALFQAAFARDNVSCLYVALTRNSAKRIMWKDVFKAIDRDKNLKCKFNETELTVTCPNGSVIYLLGMDSDEREKEKALGQKYSLVIIDEAASFTVDLHEIIYGILKPAVADYRGTIAMIGTPSNLKRGVFFDLTHDQDAGVPGRWERNGWSCHRWSARDNPYMREKWDGEVADLLKANPRVMETPLFRQHYLGQWVVDDDAKVYKFESSRNGYRGELPAVAGKGDWRYVVGLDLGFNDATAWVVAAYHDASRVLHLVESWKAEKLDITDVAHRTRSILSRYEIDRVVVDGANKQAVEELRRRHSLPLTTADKAGKAEFIDMMNSDFILGNIRVEMDRCADLVDEWQGLVWDSRITTKRVEHPACPNHCSDAALYAWRNCYAYLAEVAQIGPAQGTKEAFLLEAAKMEQEEIEAFERQQSEHDGNHWSDDWKM